MPRADTFEGAAALPGAPPPFLRHVDRPVLAAPASSLFDSSSPPPAAPNPAAAVADLLPPRLPTSRPIPDPDRPAYARAETISPTSKTEPLQHPLPPTPQTAIPTQIPTSTPKTPHRWVSRVGALTWWVFKGNYDPTHSLPVPNLGLYGGPLGTAREALRNGDRGRP